MHLRSTTPSPLTAIIALVVTSVLTLGTLACDSDGDPASSNANSQTKSSDSTAVDKLTFAFQPQENPESLAPDAEKLASFLTDQIGIESEVFLPTTYAGVVEALRSENADVAYFSGWPYLIAHQEAGAELLVVEQRNGNPYYHSRWYVRQDSDIEELSQLEGRSVSFTSPTSTSGYLFPMAEIINNSSMASGDDPGEFFDNVIYAGGYQQSLHALLEGKVDAAAASDYSFREYLDQSQRDKLRILSEQGPVPTHGVAIRGGLPDEAKQKVKQALLSLNDAENSDLLKSVYGAEKFVERTHTEHVSALEAALKTVDTDRSIEGFGAGSGAGSGSGSAHGSAPGSGNGSAQQ